MSEEFSPAMRAAIDVLGARQRYTPHVWVYYDEHTETSWAVLSEDMLSLGFELLGSDPTKHEMIVRRWARRTPAARVTTA